MKTSDASLFSIFFKHKDKGSTSNDESEDLGDVLDSEVPDYLIALAFGFLNFR